VGLKFNGIHQLMPMWIFWEKTLILSRATGWCVTNDWTRVQIGNGFIRCGDLQLQWLRHLLGCVLGALSVCCWSLVCQESPSRSDLVRGSLTVGRPTRSHVTPDTIVDFVSVETYCRSC
jgi:hypothetical protein